MALTPEQLALVTQYEAVIANHQVNVAPAGQPPQTVDFFRVSPEAIMALTKLDLERKLVLVDANLRARVEKNPAQRLNLMANIASTIEQSTAVYVGQLAAPNTPLEEQLDVYRNKGRKLVDGHYGIRRREE